MNIDKLLFEHNPFQTKPFLLGTGLYLLLLSLLGVYWIRHQPWVFAVFMIFAVTVTAFQFFSGRHAFRVYTDRIEWFNSLSPGRTVTIPMSTISQVRYEDGSFFGLRPLWGKIMMIYLHPDHGLSNKKITKGNRIRIHLGWHLGTEGLIELLRIFQEQEKQVFLSTKKKRVREALNINNWREPEILS